MFPDGTRVTCCMRCCKGAVVEATSTDHVYVRWDNRNESVMPIADLLAE